MLLMILQLPIDVRVSNTTSASSTSRHEYAMIIYLLCSLNVLDRILFVS